MTNAIQKQDEINATVGLFVGQKVGEPCGGAWLELGESSGFECDTCGAYSLGMPEAHKIEPFDYAGKIEQAWKAVEYLIQSLNLHATVRDDATRYTWDCVIEAAGNVLGQRGEVLAIGRGETAPLAICRAIEKLAASSGTGKRDG